MLPLHQLLTITVALTNPVTYTGEFVECKFKTIGKRSGWRLEFQESGEDGRRFWFWEADITKH